MLQAEPADIRRPSDLAPNTALAFSLGGSLKLPTAVRLGFEFSWLREVALGEIAGDTALRIETGAEAVLAIELAGRFLGCVRLDPTGLLTLKITNQSQFLGTRVSAHAPDPAPKNLVELCAAMLGRHESQWLAGVKRRGDAPIFFDRWDALGHRAAGAIWKAAADERDLAAVRDWVRRIAGDLRDPASFHQAVAAALDAAPDFACSAPARWIEAAAGSLLAPEFDKLLAAVDGASRLLNEDGLLRMLCGLKQRAAAQALASLEGVPRTIAELASTIYRRGIAALAKKCAVELSRLWQPAAAGAALLDCSFEFTDAGLAAYHEALTGDFTRALAPGAARVRLGLLTHALAHHAAIDLRLPFIERKYWPSYVATLGHVHAQDTDCGRVVVTGLWPVPHQVPGSLVETEEQVQRQELYQHAMTLCGALALDDAEAAPSSIRFSDRRRLKPFQARAVLPRLLRAYDFMPDVETWLDAALPRAHEVEVTLSLSVTGEAIAAWLHVPGEHDPRFRPVCQAISKAVQAAMRRWLPYVYFSDLSRYDSSAAATPLIAYQSTLPFRVTGGEYGYEIVSEQASVLNRASTGWGVAAEMARIRRLLRAAGKRDEAESYDRKRKSALLRRLARHPHPFNTLLAADAMFVECLIRLGVRAGRLKEAMARDPHGAVRRLLNFAAEVSTAFHRRLRYLYCAQDFVPFGSLILLEATAALKGKAAISAVLHLKVEPTGCEQTFVNKPLAVSCYYSV